MIHIYDNIPHAQATILRRTAWDEQALPAALLAGIERIFGQRLTPEQAVAAVLADVRGRGDSGCEWASFKLEARDGYETVESSALLPGADGQVGMFGASYYGFTQWMAAREAPPSLKAIVPAGLRFSSTTSSPPRGHGITWSGGADWK